MASYTEKVFANDGYLINMRGGISRPSVLKTYTEFEMTGYNSDAVNQFDSSKIVFPKPSQYPKKRVTGRDVYIYVTNVDYFGSGSLPEGDFLYQFTDKSGDFFLRFDELDYGADYNLKNISQNQYLKVDFFKSENPLQCKIGVTGNMYAGEEYQANASLSFHGHSAGNPPYAIYQLEDVIAYTTNEFPKSGFIDAKKENTFSWKFAYDKTPTAEYGGSYDILDEIYQGSAKFRWKQKSAVEYTEIPLSGNTQSITIPANTFTGDEIQWQVIVTSDDGIEGTPSDWYTLTTVDSTSSAKAVSPVNVVVDGSYPIEFRWNHVIDTGSDQTKYELEYSDDNGLEWKPLKSEETSNTFATIPENTLPAGNLLWKVRTYNSDGAAGSWSEPAGIIVRAAPQAPSITSISAEARPTVRWQSVGQEAYEIAVYSGETLLYTTGETAGTEKQKKIPEYLAPGTYTVQIRIWNAYNIESPWSSGSVQIPENTLTPPGITATTRPGVVEIQISGTGYEKFYLLRDGVPIAKILSGAYQDYAVSAGKHSYVARGVTAEDAFADSEPQEVTVSLPYAVIASADNLASFTPLIYRRNAEPSWTENLQSMGQAVFVTGRKKPFFESAEYWNNVLSFAFSYRTREEYDALRKLLLDGKTVRYRGKDGTAYWMAITGLQTTTDYLSKDFTISAQEVDYVEKIEYDTEES